MQEQRFLIATILLVGLIGTPAVYSVVKDPTAGKSRQAKIGTVVAPAGRQPANSEKSDSPSRTETRSKSVVLDYPCQNRGKTLEVDGTLLRLKGGSCISKKWQNLLVVNQANGFTGSVIFLKDSRFTTDFIDLQEGDNQIRIQGQDEKGRFVSQVLTVKRRTPAAIED